MILGVVDGVDTDSVYTQGLEFGDISLAHTRVRDGIFHLGRTALIRDSVKLYMLRQSRRVSMELPMNRLGVVKQASVYTKVESVRLTG
jgi:hypothetical protein